MRERNRAARPSRARSHFLPLFCSIRRNTVATELAALGEPARTWWNNKPLFCQRKMHAGGQQRIAVNRYTKAGSRPSSMARGRSSCAREAHGFSRRASSTWCSITRTTAKSLRSFCPRISRRWNSMSRRCRLAGNDAAQAGATCSAKAASGSEADQLEPSFTRRPWPPPRRSPRRLDDPASRRCARLCRADRAGNKAWRGAPCRGARA